MNNLPDGSEIFEPQNSGEKAVSPLRVDPLSDEAILLGRSPGFDPNAAQGGVERKIQLGRRWRHTDGSLLKLDGVGADRVAMVYVETGSLSRRFGYAAGDTLFEGTLVDGVTIRGEYFHRTGMQAICPGIDPVAYEMLATLSGAGSITLELDQPSIKLADCSVGSSGKRNQIQLAPETN